MLVALLLSSSYVQAQVQNQAKAGEDKVVKQEVLNTNKLDENAKAIREAKIAEITEINKQIYEAKKAGKPYKELIEKRKEIMKNRNYNVNKTAN